MTCTGDTGRTGCRETEILEGELFCLNELELMPADPQPRARPSKNNSKQIRTERTLPLLEIKMGWTCH